MLEPLRKHTDIILSWRITRYEQYGASLRLRMEITFIDGSKLLVRETVLEGKERKYAYHWQSGEGKPLVRWDNAPHWDIETAPHHKHDGTTNAVEPSYQRTLDQVLDVIDLELRRNKE